MSSVVQQTIARRDMSGIGILGGVRRAGGVDQPVDTIGCLMVVSSEVRPGAKLPKGADAEGRRCRRAQVPKGARAEGRTCRTAHVPNSATAERRTCQRARRLTAETAV